LSSSVKTTGAGVVMIVAGFWMRSHFEPYVQVCQSGLGGLVQDFSQTASSNCSSAQHAVEAAPWLIGIGFVLAIGGVLAMVGVLAGLGVALSGTKRGPAAGTGPGATRAGTAGAGRTSAAASGPASTAGAGAGAGAGASAGAKPQQAPSSAVRPEPGPGAAATPRRETAQPPR